MASNTPTKIQEILQYLNGQTGTPPQFSSLQWHDGRQPAINATNLNRYEKLLNTLINNKGFTAEGENSTIQTGFLPWAIDILSRQAAENDGDIGDLNKFQESLGTLIELQDHATDEKPLDDVTTLVDAINRVYTLLKECRTDEINRLQNIHMSDIGYDSNVYVLNCGDSKDDYVKIDPQNSEDYIAAHNDGRSKLPSEKG